MMFGRACPERALKGKSGLRAAPDGRICYRIKHTERARLMMTPRSFWHGLLLWCLRRAIR